MDQATLERLEFDRILERLAEHCGSAAGGALAQALDVHSDAAAVRALLSETTEARRFLDNNPPDWYFGSLPDTAPALATLTQGVLLEPIELHCLRMLLDFAALIKRTAPPLDRFTCIAGLSARIEPAPELSGRIARAVDATGAVLDTASPELARARRGIRRLERDIPALLHTYINDPAQRDVVQDRLVTIRNGRFVVPLIAGRMRGDAFVLQDRSSSGSTAFAEPLHVIAQNNALAQERINERNAVLTVLRELTDMAREHLDALKQTHEALAQLDLLLARGRLSIAMRANEPLHATDDTLTITAGRHPLLPGASVPIDITLGGDTRALVLTGPNAGGKTVALKMAGLFALMAQAGLHVPADQAVLPVFGQIFAVIGDEQSIELSLSTFTSHLHDLARIIDHAGRGSLVLIDEICSGTDPQEGTALACSVIKRLMDDGAVCMATSHHGGLKTFASVTPGARNARVLFDEQLGAPRFIVEIGLPGKSHALDIAARAGLNPDIISSARRYLDSRTRMAEELLAELENVKSTLAMEHDELARRKEQLDQEQRHAARVAEKQLTEAEVKHRDILARAVAEAEQLVEQTRAQCRDLLERAGAAATLPQKAEVKGAIKKQEHRIQKAARRATPPRGRALTARDLSPGAVLLLSDTFEHVTFVSGPDRKGMVKVLLGELPLSTPLRELRALDAPPAPRPAYRPPPDHTRYIDEAHRNAPESIDLHGMHVAEAFELLDRELPNIHMAGRDRCAICHGIGTGTLMKAVHEYLARNPLVRRFEPAPLREGGIGVTIIFFKD